MKLVVSKRAIKGALLVKNGGTLQSEIDGVGVIVCPRTGDRYVALRRS